MSKLFLDILDKKRLKLFETLKQFKDIGILGGGTDLGLQIGHRKSFDFDIFTFEPLPSNLWKKVKNVLGAGCTKTLEIQDQLNLATPENISITFFHDDYGFLFEPISTNYLDLMDLRDLSTTKALAIGRRGKWRDYVDIYFLLKRKIVSLEEIIKFSEQRIGGEFSARLFLQQLVYFDDIIDYKIEYFDEEVRPETVKEYLVGEIEKIVSLFAV